MEIKNILFPTDFSRGSEAAAALAADLAVKYGARLHMLHIIYDVSRDSAWFSPGSRLDDLYDGVKKGAAEEMERIRLLHFKGMADIVTSIIIGSPFEDIITYGRENSIDMIVMGTHGRTGLDRIIFGSTAHRVVRRSTCPVLTIRERK